MGIFSWLRLSSTQSPEEPGWLRRWVFPKPGRPDPKLEAIQRAAAEDVEAMEKEDREFFERHGPGYIEDDL
jgi:hypothetical protein